MFFNKRMFENLNLTFSTKGELFINHLDQTPIPLFNFQKIIEKQFQHKKDAFINFFLNTPIFLEKDITIVEILKALLPWKKNIENIIKKDIDSYLKYLSQESQNLDKWLGISFNKQGSLKEINKHTKSLFDIDYNFKEFHKYQIKTGVCALTTGHSYQVFYDKDGHVESFSGDPLIDILSYKDVPIFIENEYVFHSELFDINNECVTTEEADFFNNSHKIKVKTEFSLLDLLYTLQNFLYFESPLTDNEKQSNYLNFVEHFKTIEKQSVQEDSIPPNNKLWNGITSFYLKDKK